MKKKEEFFLGYALETPRRCGSNEYPQCMFWIKNKKNRYAPCKPKSYYIKWVLYISRTCFPDVSHVQQQTGCAAQYIKAKWTTFIICICITWKISTTIDVLPWNGQSQLTWGLKNGLTPYEMSKDSCIECHGSVSVIQYLGSICHANAVNQDRVHILTTLTDNCTFCTE